MRHETRWDASRDPEGGFGEEDAGPLVSMGVASKRTGLPATVLRSWEERYGAVRPARSEGGHRLYSESELERLELLGTLTEREHRISTIARLPDRMLRVMLGREGVGKARERIQAAISTMDSERLETELRRVAFELTPGEVVDEVLLPTIRGLGSDGRFEARPAERYLAREALGATMDWLVEEVRGPGTHGLVAVRPVVGSARDDAGWVALAASVVGVVAAQARWDVRILGPELASRALRSAVDSLRPRLVVMVLASGLLRPESPTAGAVDTDEWETLGHDTGGMNGPETEEDEGDDRTRGGSEEGVTEEEKSDGDGTVEPDRLATVEARHLEGLGVDVAVLGGAGPNPRAAKRGEAEGTRRIGDLVGLRRHLRALSSAA